MNFFRRAKDFIFGGVCAFPDAHHDSLPVTPVTRSKPDPRAQATNRDDGPDGQASGSSRGYNRGGKRREPVLIDAPGARVQGLDWYSSGLKRDADGDIAHEFIEMEQPPDRKQSVRVKSARVAELAVQDGHLSCK